MKKVLLIAAIAVFGFTSVQAQEEGFKAGITLGLPIGDVSDGYTFNASLDLAYLFDIADSFQVGPALGYSHYFGDEVLGFEIDDATFLPIAASARFFASEDFFFGADLGYAVGLSPDGNDGGFYYKPKVGYNLGSVAILASYSGISVDGGTFSAIGLGVEFGL
ncbi:MAG: hypothetical protein NXH73_05500 [Flavobacteriaceae bacterium]|nr:hypothetical protein [Flavobacteriaceae bacterium]